jgi:heme/copper-type cytochrome/quinol oxidase subunit 2
MRTVWKFTRAWLAATAVWLLATGCALAADPPAPDPAEAGGGISDYMLSYLVVILGIVLGLLVVAKASNRRDRERPAGYVEKNIMADE